MTKREQFLNYVRNGDSVPRVSMQIGGGAGFDTKLAGKVWVSETTLEETLAAAEQIGGDILMNVGLPNFGVYNSELEVKNHTLSSDHERIIHSGLETPFGTLEWEYRERPKQGVTPVKYPIRFGDSLDPVRWLIERHYASLNYIPEMVGGIIDLVHPHYALCIQWSVQPFELLCLTPAPDAVMFAMNDTDNYRHICDEILAFNIACCQAVIETGVDFIFLGGPGRELMSPFLYDVFIVPDSKEISKTVHDAGGMVYSHICSPVQPFLDMGYYNDLGIDLFETLSPPPVGNVESLRAARQKLPKTMCTRGNIGLDLLLTGTSVDVRNATRRIIQETTGYKHFIAASDYLFYEIPVENVLEVVRTVEEFS